MDGHGPQLQGGVQRGDRLRVCLCDPVCDAGPGCPLRPSPEAIPGAEVGEGRWEVSAPSLTGDQEANTLAGPSSLSAMSDIVTRSSG